jgi:hypothetical protein
MVLTMTLSQLLGSWERDDPNYSRPAADLVAAMESAIAKARKRNPSLKTDDAVLAALGILQKMWDHRMTELRAAAREPHQMEKRPQPIPRRSKKNRLTAFLG